MKNVKKQSVLKVPKVLRKLNKLKNAFKRSKYRHTLLHTNATYSKGS